MTNHDTDPTELTPPDGHRNWSLPPDASRSEIIDRFNRLLGALYRITDEVSALHQVMVGDSPCCPRPELRCAALDMAETANIGVVELMGKNRRNNVAALVIIGVLSAAAGVFGSWLGYDVRKEARAQTISTLETEMPKYLKTVERVSSEASREGGKAGALEVIEDVRSGQLLVRK